MTRCVVEAVVDSGVCAILSKGWSDRGAKKSDDKDEEGDEEKDDKEKVDEKKQDDKEEKGDKEEKDDEEDEDDKEGADGVKYPPEILCVFPTKPDSEPANLSPIDSIDHSWLFPRIDAACHHGGAGTSGASLRAGIVSGPLSPPG